MFNYFKTLNEQLDQAHGIFGKARDEYRKVRASCLDQIERSREIVAGEKEKIVNAESVLGSADRSITEINKIIGDE